MQISSNLKKRIKNLNLLSKVTNPTNVLSYFKEIKSPIYMGWSGFTGVGYPKIIPIELANYVEKNNLKGKMKFNIYVGASVGYEVEDRWASLDMIDRLFPYQSGKDIQNGINHGKVKFNDKHLSMFAQDLVYGFYTKDKDSKKLDFSIIEITGITKDGGLIPGLSVGAIPEIIQSSDKVILEINTASPECEGLHDLLYTEEPPNRKPYLIEKVNDRIGKTFLPIDPNKIIAIVESPLHDTPTEVHSDMNCGKMISNHIVEFLQNEVKHNRLPSNLLPIQSGVGNISNAVIGGLVNSPFNNLEVWTEVIQDTFLDFFDRGKVSFASTTSVKFSREGFEHFFKNWDKYKQNIIIRPQHISNSPEIIRRLGVICMNTPIEVDIYAHANSTLILGSKMVNGIGGSGDFLRNGKLSIMHCPSTRPTKTDPFGITTIVPMCPHIDHTEHDLDIIVTEQGLADVRGLSPIERANLIIEKCAHPEYKPILKDYMKIANKFCLEKGMAHEPHLLEKVFKMHNNLLQYGTMKIKEW